MRKTNDQKSWLERIVRQVTGVTASFIVLALSSSDRVTATEPDLGLRIWVANYAHVPTRDISKAKGIATSIFNDAGIEMMWIDLPLEGKHLESKYDSRLGDIHLTILRRAAPGTFSPHELGFAMPCPEPKVGCLAYISYSLIEDVARDGDVPKSDILGAAMAHEMGHILLGAGHSPMGIMKPHWNEHDLRGVAWHQLIFTPDEARSLRGLGKPLIRGNDAKN